MTESTYTEEERGRGGGGGGGMEGGRGGRGGRGGGGIERERGVLKYKVWGSAIESWHNHSVTIL